ncbi:ABC transporter permease DevC [Anabaena sp. FACHB-709]|uniref:Heterocyst specific ABC-transporter, membrane spanning subunit DevC n=3 Tax=Nostocaceae TaxID=1162 RepID=A0A1Z4KK40_ANAVA|nr:MULTISPECIES: ABC transporter permease DevC [Nostocaceae]BAY69336.1 heterocyst specific ABC-transporter, membrane spanning subunit DevC [Trichormus variabilis NIES-23]HBW28498.1 ABC transporter permease [Nostoc sp. UBA8866]MBD2174502.1 FtsX-like permease family protein [Anabaena cylindrica FACHB-318]MBD2266262.1 FtsX-like permease family protein [Anabaena sp. FACHB-709]MBD2275637.1 FtsX-like permease family protein [Nostoc sp. PCC 7120 = FACHB-418]
MNRKRIPLSWLQLTREKTRLAVALAGIAFADILMFMQIGFRDALYYSNVRLHTSLQGDIVLLNKQSNAVLAMKPFSQRRLYKSLELPSVQSVHPIYLDYSIWKNPYTGLTRSILVFGINPETNIFNLAGVQENLDKLKLPDTVLFDRSSRPEYGPIAKNFEQGQSISAEVRRRRINVVGLFTLGASFGADGNLVTSDVNFLRLFPLRRQGLIDIGLIRLKPGVNPNTAVQELRSYLPDDINVLTKQEFIDFERNYWASSTAIGFIFTLGTIMGFIVGTVIVYQILYTEVADHLSEYATLKAIGYTQKYLLGVILQEALLLACLGYLPGWIFAIILYKTARQATLLPVFMSYDRAITVLILTMIMCFVSGSIAVRKLRSADPADIF